MGKETRFEDIRLVMAYSASEAEQKYADYWQNKTDPYSMYYSAFGEAQETLI